MPEPLISICIPAYHAERHLRETLASVAAQAFTDWELIVTEDGSRDGTEEIVRTFASEVSQPVSYRRHEQNRGLPATRNAGISSARGEWIALLDADDVWLPQHLAELAKVAKDPDVSLVHSGSQVFDDTTGADLYQRVPTAADLALFPISLYTGSYIIQPSSVMIRQVAWEKCGPFSEAFPICNDLEYWLRLASRGGAFRCTGGVTCRYRKHAAAMSAQSAALIAESARVCERYADWKSIPVALRRAHPAELFTSAGRMVLRHDPRRARQYFQAALRAKGSAPRLAYWLAASALSLVQRKSRGADSPLV